MKLGYLLLVIGMTLAGVRMLPHSSIGSSCDYTAMGDITFCGP